MSTPMVPRKSPSERWTQFKDDLRILLHREAIVLDLVKASLPLYLALGAAMAFGFGYTIIDAAREERVAKERNYQICINRNSQVEQGRLDNVSTVQETVNELSDPTSPEMVRLIERINATQHATVSDVDQDCNGDKVLDADDYSNPVPPQPPGSIQFDSKGLTMYPYAWGGVVVVGLLVLVILLATGRV